MSARLPPLEEVRRRRGELGLTQSKLGALAGVSQSIIAKLESGDVDPSYSIVRKVFGALDRVGVSPSLKVSELMSHPVVSVSRMQLVREAVDLMKRKGYSALPVFDSARPVGSISEKTILDRAARGEPLEGLMGRRIREIMDSSLPTVGEETPLDLVFGLLQGNYGVLVTRGPSVIGILTKSDLLKTRR